MLKKSLYLLSILSANIFLTNLAFAETEDLQIQKPVFVEIDSAKIEQLQDMYFNKKDAKEPNSHFNHEEQFDFFSDIAFE